MVYYRVVMDIKLWVLMGEGWWGVVFRGFMCGIIGVRGREGRGVGLGVG